MRKRLREELPRKDKSKSPGGGGRQKRKLKSSEIARDLECCENILMDAKRSYEQLVALNSQALTKRCMESVDIQPLPPIRVDITNPDAFKQQTLALPMPPDAGDIDPFEHTTTFEPKSGKGSFEMRHKQSSKLPCPEVAAAEASQVILSFLQRLTQRGIFLNFATTPEFVRDIFTNCHGKIAKEVESVEQPECSSLMHSREEVAEESKQVEPENPSFSRFSRDEEVAEMEKDVEPEKPSSLGLIRVEVAEEAKDVEHKQPASLELNQEEVAEETKDVEHEQPSSLGLSREELAEESKEIEPDKPSFLGLNDEEEVAEEAIEVELEKPSYLGLNQEEVSEESKEVKPESPADLTFSREVAEEPKEVEAAEKQYECDFLLLGRREKIVSESDVEDDDGLKHLWDVMEFSLACMKETKNSRVEADNKQNDGCIHEFYKRDDVGLVCSKCGLIGQDAEYIFNYVWGERPSKRHSGNELVVAKQITVPGVKEPSDQLENLSVCEQTTKPLVLHPRYKEKLRTHQEEGLRFLEDNLVQDEPSGCILAHAPGTGKSFTIIAFLQSFQTAYPDEKPLIVAPKGMLSVWVREFEKWKVEDITILNLQEAKSVEGDIYSNTDALGHQLKRHRQLQMLRQWKAQKSVLMVGYPTFSTLTGDKDASAFPEIKKILLEAPGILILDEGHFPRNKKTQITQSLSQVRTKRRVLLSGTLFQNNFDELYNLYHLVKPDFMSSNASCTKGLLENFMRVSSSPAKGGLTSSKSPRKRSGREAVELDIFKDLGETIRSGEKERKKQAISQLRQLSEPFVHWYKGQILADLPGLIDLTLLLKLTDKQQELLSSLSTKVEKQLDWFTESTNCMQICIHPVLLKADVNAVHSSDIRWNDNEEDPRSSAKIMFILDLLQLAAPMKEKVVLFSKYLDPFYLLERVLKKAWGWSLNQEILKIEGRTSLEERESTIDRFNENSKAKILLASIKTCGEGISLIGASRIVLLDVHWNPMVSRQAISRAFRIGQRKKVFVYRLVGGGTKEEDAHLKACEKEWLAKQIFEGCNEEDYSLYCHEVNPQEVDLFFESQYLRENILRCFRYRFA